MSLLMKYCFPILAFLVLPFGGICQQVADFSFTSGRLLIDSEKKDTINSPYISYQKHGTEQWIAYDPLVKEGRFQSVSASFTGAATCGYIVGDFRFLGSIFRADRSYRTGIALSVDFDKTLQWSYLHRSSLVGSAFTHCVKLADGRVLVSGYEYASASPGFTIEDKAILLCLDKEGKIQWRIDHPAGRGYEVRRDERGAVYWQVARSAGKENLGSIIYQVDQFTGSFTGVVEEPGTVSDGKLTFNLTSNKGLITARLLDNMSDDLNIVRYDEYGVVLWDRIVANGELSPKGVVEDPNNGGYKVALEVDGDVQFHFAGNQVIPDRGLSLILISLGREGVVTSLEQYGAEFLKINGFFQAGNNIGIMGSHIGKLNIHHNHLVFDSENDKEQAFAIYLSEPEEKFEELDRDIIGEAALEDVHDLVIYPNPVSEGSITVVNKLKEAEVFYKVSVYDNLGVLQAELVRMAAKEITADLIDISTLASGIYHVYVFQHDQVISKGRFIISK